MEDALLESLASVRDGASLIKFVNLLASDRPEEWENSSAVDFLLAASAWAKDSEFGVRPGLRPENPWQQFAMFLWAGSRYE
jgi:hypothetical protein